MINANELRIGNLITDPEFPSIPSIVDEIQNDGFIVTTFNDHLTNKLATPIELTDQWLLDFGFKKWGRDDIKSTVSFEKGIINFQKYDDNNSYGWMWEKLEENKPSSWKPKVEIKFVHQLQNLWFCLTGFELSVVANGS